MKYTVALMATLVLGLGVMTINDAHAEELSQQRLDKIMERAYELSVLIEDAQDRGAENRAERLQEKFDKKVAILNEHGYITTEQLEEDPAKYDNTIGELSPSQGVTTQCHCDEDQILFVDTGYYKNTWWIFWDWVYSEGNAELTFPGDSNQVDVVVEDSGKIKPGMRVQLQMPGQGTFSYVYSYEGDLVESGVTSTTKSSHPPQIIVLEERSNASVGDLIEVYYTAITITP